MWSNTWTMKDVFSYITRLKERYPADTLTLKDYLYNTDSYGSGKIPVFDSTKDGGFGGNLYNIYGNIFDSTDPQFEKPKGLYVYRIPVIEKSYYDENKRFLNEIFMYSASQVDLMFNSYKMLTDGCNLKFAKTYGTITNLRYNDNIPKIADELKYGNWTAPLPPKFKVKVFIKKNPTKSVREIVVEAKKVIFTFLQLRSDFNAKIVRSEVSRYLHDVVPDITSCDIVEPTRDILYLYEERHLPRNKHLILSYVPEFVWIDIDEIDIVPIVLP
jgi:hypothetical protein